MMPRYLVERSYPNRIGLPGPEDGAEARQSFIENNDLDGVTWLHSYVSPGGKKSFCVYDAPTPEAVRRAAQRNGLPVDRITEVSVLDPYFYDGTANQTGEEPRNLSDLLRRSRSEKT